ncbi:MAG: nucleotidyltransferase domain-containing protein [Candidatus Nanoarchaeia archaeon]
MEFNVQKKQDISEKQKEKYENSEIEIAYKFSKEIYKELGHFIKAVVLFGSKANQPKNHEGDIDILLVVDDVTYYMTSEVVEAYRLIVENKILKISKRIHITTLKFTSFWDYVRQGDPIALNMLRDGVALIDTGFFTPIQMLLFSGEVRPSKEAVMAYMARSTQAFNNSGKLIVQATLDLYWAVVDAAQAAIMKAGEMPPNPAHVPDILHKLVKQKLISKKSPKIMKSFYSLAKQILHNKKTHVSATEYETLYKEAQTFINDLKKFINKKN